MITHGIHQGKPLCGFADGHPRTWPINNNHVPAEEGYLHLISCDMCKEKVGELSPPPQAEVVELKQA